MNASELTEPLVCVVKHPSANFFCSEINVLHSNNNNNDILSVKNERPYHKSQFHTL